MQKLMQTPQRTKTMSNDDIDPFDSAMADFLRTPGAPQPSGGNALESVGERDYVVLRNVSGILAVYRVLPHGVKRLQRWPKEISRDI